LSILAVAVTTIECDGHSGAACPGNTVIEYPRPQSVAIRLAKQSGWTVWMETMCPECSNAEAPVSAPAPAVPETVVEADAAVPALMVLEADAGVDAVGWCARMKAERRRMPVCI
jgi:hypothetical protein